MVSSSSDRQPVASPASNPLVFDGGSITDQPPRGPEGAVGGGREEARPRRWWGKGKQQGLLEAVLLAVIGIFLALVVLRYPSKPEKPLLPETTVVEQVRDPAVAPLPPVLSPEVEEEQEDDVCDPDPPLAPVIAPSVVAVGLDLGTTYTVMGVHPDAHHRVADEASGRQALQVLLNKEGKLLTPSLVHFSADGEASALVGSAAVKHLIKSPASTAYLAKRLIGRSFDDPEVAKVASMLNYRLVACPKSIRIPLAGGPNGTTTTHVLTGFGGRVCMAKAPPALPVPMPLEMASALVLYKMRTDAAAKLLRNVTEVSHAVITVPAWFEEKQKEATVQAAQMAGLQVLQLLPEPTAAAMTYFYKHDPKGLKGPFKMVVIDFGGGTLDVSVLHYSRGKFKVKGVGGDLHLGGEDLDHALASRLMAMAFKGHRRHQPTARVTAEFRAEAEEAKKHLSTDTKAAVYLPGVLPGGRDADLTVDRSLFEEVASPFVRRAVGCIERTLQDAEVKLSGRDKVLLVGGSSRIPLFRQEVKRLFSRWGADVLTGALDEDLAVAQGAALLAYRASEPALFSRLFPAFGMTDVTTRTIGIAVCKDPPACSKTVSRPVIPRFTALPASGDYLGSTVRDYQEVFNCYVLEGEETAAADNRDVALVTVSKIQNATAGRPRLRASFSINETTGLLHVTAYDMAFKEAKQELDVAYYNGIRMSKQQMQVASEVASQMAASRWN